MVFLIFFKLIDPRKDEIPSIIAFGDFLRFIFIKNLGERHRSKIRSIDNIWKQNNEPGNKYDNHKDYDACDHSVGSPHIVAKNDSELKDTLQIHLHDGWRPYWDDDKLLKDNLVPTQKFKVCVNHQLLLQRIQKNFFVFLIRVLA